MFRVESVPPNAAPGSAYRLSDLDLASRLSFFLWSSVPDDELRNLAILGRLKEPKVLEQQVQRMLHDPRSRALVDGFANRWLGLSKLAGLFPIPIYTREFDESLRDAMAKETQIFVASQLQEDRSVMELLTADYTYVNERLAKHYGIPNIYGDRFRRVKFTDGVRGGLLGQAEHTGGDVLPESHFGSGPRPVFAGESAGCSPPPPPPDVPALKDAGTDGQPRALRQRMELHRKNAVCASCHQRMDPLGFALENFDALGKWRTESDGAPIDASASMPDGTRFEGVGGLRALLSSSQRRLRSYFHGEIAGVRHRPRHRIYRLARHPQDCTRCGAARVPLVQHHFRDRQQHTVQHEHRRQQHASEYWLNVTSWNQEK